MTNELWQLILMTGLAGACIPFGGVLATFESVLPNWLEKELRHLVIAFGGGILLGAVAVVLVPQGVDSMNNSLFSIPVVILGGVTFLFIEWRLGLRRRESPQLMGMILDYIPEAIALGGLIAIKSPVAPLVALLIGLQNFPEGFNTYRELNDAGKRTRLETLVVMSALVPAGPIAGLAGYYFLGQHPFMLGAIMCFASGGILYLLFQDIAPQSRLESHWLPPIGAVLGFSLVLFSDLLVHSS